MTTAPPEAIVPWPARWHTYGGLRLRCVHCGEPRGERGVGIEWQSIAVRLCVPCAEETLRVVRVYLDAPDRGSAEA